MCMLKNSIKSQLGVLLLEGVLALVIISVTFLALIKLQGYYITVNDVAKQRIQASAFAQAKMESFRAYDALLAGNGTLAYEDITSGTDVVNGENATYQRSWSVTENATLGYKTITVTVSWSLPDGNSQSVILASIVGRDDISGSGDALLP